MATVSERSPEVANSTNRLVSSSAVALLALMGILMFTSSWNDTITFDEEAHIGAGYANLREADSRLNAEHPPLMKDLAAIPLLFLKLRPPWNDPLWQQDQFEQWEFGKRIIFNSGGDPDGIMRAARAPIILFTIALGGLIFLWARKHFGGGVALLALFLYTFSPTFLAHGRLVTTDVGAAAGFFVGTIAFLRFLREPARRNVLFAGLAMGFAFLTKFSTILLVPVALTLAVAWTFVRAERGNFARSLLLHLRRTVWIFVVAMLPVYLVYLHHTWNYLPQYQRSDAEIIRTQFEMHGDPPNAVVWASNKPVLRPLAQFFLGLLMNIKRSNDGNSPYFLGEIFPRGQHFYFPFVYMAKEPLALHLLTLLALVFAISRMIQPAYRREWLEAHFSEFAFLLLLACYWIFSIRSSLNIGVRHLLAIFPFIYILVADQILVRYRRLRDHAPETELQGLSPAATRASLWTLRLVLGAALLWQAVSVLRVHPSYLAYFNELAGGPDGGWRYVVDSNIDWGQDLNRLTQYVDKNGISAIHLDYFGAAEPAVYLKGKYLGFSSCDGPQQGWIAVSAMWYADSRRKPECDYRRWLPMDKLVTKIGYSIFVFHVD
jgi:4-amino-4-deoxy-L-arabinose transferase-like glycosyltransferase